MLLLALIQATSLEWSMGLTASAQTSPGNPPPYTSGLNGEDRLFFSASPVRSVDAKGTHLQGFHLGVGFWDETGDVGARSLYFISREQGGAQIVTSGGLNLGAMMLRAGPFRAFPSIKVGLTHRKHSPAAGLEGFSGLGIEAMTWLGNDFQVAATVERTFGSRSGTSDQLGLALRWSPKAFDTSPRPAH